uniref:Secreted protein n=2 Tax=Caenorhabditis tropicalis TaxID=1561998 RepID=A0A1I7TF87_9PELO
MERESDWFNETFQFNMNKIVYSSLAILAIIAISQVQSAVLPVSSKEVALVTSSTLPSSSSETSIDTLGSSRVKRQGGGCGCCGCGCGCCGCGGGGGGCGCCCYVVAVVVVPVVVLAVVPDVVLAVVHVAVDVDVDVDVDANLRITLANKIEGIAKIVKGTPEMNSLAPMNDDPTTVQEKKDVIN